MMRILFGMIMGVILGLILRDTFLEYQVEEES